MTIIEKQLDFYKNKKSGCTFASILAHNPSKYKWKHFIVNEVNNKKIDDIIIQAIKDRNISTVSIIFPSVISSEDFIYFITVLEKCENIVLEQDIVKNNYRCLGFRAKVFNNLSWISGFGNFDFLPKTRQAPYTELVFRVKNRPNFDKYMKPPIKGVVHLADMNMQGMEDNIFKRLWASSLLNTKKVLGHTPNLHSAAKTTYSIPSKLLKV